MPTPECGRPARLAMHDLRGPAVAELVDEGDLVTDLVCGEVDDVGSLGLRDLDLVCGTGLPSSPAITADLHERRALRCGLAPDYRSPRIASGSWVRDLTWSLR